MTDVTQILPRMDRGDPSAAAELLPLVYDELRVLAAAQMAHEQPGQTLQATALVHEAYLRLVGRDEMSQWESRRHFFGAAAEAMRRILIDQARRKQSEKRGPDWKRVELALIDQPALEDAVDVLALDEALDRLAARDRRAAELVKLRYFAGLTAAQAAVALGLAERTADRVWVYARSFLLKELTSPVR